MMNTSRVAVILCVTLIIFAPLVSISQMAFNQAEVLTNNDFISFQENSDVLDMLKEEGIAFNGAAGNHEIYKDDLNVQDDDYGNCLEFFDYSDVVDQPGETELHYSFDMNGIHFIILNTVEEWEGDIYTCPAAKME